jgi:hypothetical protein
LEVTDVDGRRRLKWILKNMEGRALIASFWLTIGPRGGCVKAVIKFWVL